MIYIIEVHIDTLNGAIFPMANVDWLFMVVENFRFPNKRNKISPSLGHISQVV